MKEVKRNRRILFWSVELLVIACLIFISTKIQFIFKPIVAFSQTVFAPLLLAVFLYYILNPMVKLLERIKIKRLYAIILVFLLLIGAVAFLFMRMIPSLLNQLIQLAHSIPGAIKVIESWLASLNHEAWINNFPINEYLQKFDAELGRILKGLIMNLSTGMSSVISSVTTTLVTAVTAPIMLFYLLKDGHRFIPAISKYLPRNVQDDTAKLLHKMSQTLSSYISGQAMECVFVAICTFIGYELIGIQYAFLFAVIAGLTNMIPYLGPYLGLAPAVITTLFTSPVKALLCCVIVLIVQQIDSNIIYPNVIGKSLDIHPMTIIIILLIAGNIAGVLGMFLGVPVYAIAKTVFNYLYEVYQLHKDPKMIE